MTIEEKLAAMRERLSAAEDHPDWVLAIGDSQADMAPLLSAVEAVLELHKPVSVQVITGDCATEDCDHDEPYQHQTEAIDHCEKCWELAEEVDYYFSEERAYLVTYPCDTVRTLTDKLKGDDDERLHADHGGSAELHGVRGDCRGGRPTGR